MKRSALVSVLVLWITLSGALPTAMAADELISPELYRRLSTAGKALDVEMQQSDDLLYRMKLRRDSGLSTRSGQYNLDERRSEIEARYRRVLEVLDLIGDRLEESGRADLLEIHEKKTETLRQNMQKILSELEQGDLNELMDLGLPLGKVRTLRLQQEQSFQKTRSMKGSGKTDYPGATVTPLKRAPRETLNTEDKKKLLPEKEAFGLQKKDLGYELVRLEAGTGAGEPRISPAVSWDMNLPQTARPVLVAGLGDVAGLLSPATLQAITPPTAADLAEDGLDIVFTPEIGETAEYLNHDAVTIYEYVKNNFLYQPYWGALKGAHQTLMSGSGNDADQASLLIALLRRSGVPARYGRALVTVDIERAKKWLGVADDTCVDLMLATGELPGVTALVDDSTNKIMAVRFEHIYVEAWLPYGNYRGTARDQTHKLWVPLAPAFKEHRVVAGVGLAQAVPFDADALADYLDGTMTKNPDGSLSGIDEAWMQQQLQDYEQQLQDYLADNMTIHEVTGYTEIVAQNHPILPITLPFKAENGQSFSALADSLHYRVQVKLAGSGGVDQAEALGTLLLDWEAPIQSIAGQRLTLTCAPTNMDDIAGVPPYLVEMRPRLRLNGAVALEGSGEVTMGVDTLLRVEIVSPNSSTGLTHQYDYRVSAGDIAAIVLSSDRISGYVLDSSERLTQALQEQSRDRDEIVGEQLYMAGLTWFYQVDVAARSSAKHYNVYYFRKPSALVCYGHLNTARVGGITTGVEGAKLILDAGNNYFMAIPRTTDLMSRVRFAIAQGPDMSAYEHIVLEEMFQIEAVSAVKLMQVANAQDVPVYEITSDNRATMLPNLQLPADDMLLIENELDRGQIVTAPRTRLTAGNYNGAGIISITPQGDDPYISIRNAYLISGAENGAELYEVVDDWLNDQDLGGWFDYGDNKNTVVQTIVTDSDAILATGKKYYEKYCGKLSDQNNVNYSNYIGAIIYDACTSAWRERFWPFVTVGSVNKTVLLRNVGIGTLMIYIDYEGNHTFEPGVERMATWRVISMYGGHYNNSLLPVVSKMGDQTGFSGRATEGSGDGDFFFTDTVAQHGDEITIELKLNYRSFMCLNENSQTRTTGKFKAVKCGLESLKRREGDTFPIPLGETSGVVAEITDPNVDIEWSWQVEERCTSEDQPPITLDTNIIDEDERSIYEITPTEESGFGWIKVTARDKHNDECLKEAKIYIGCPTCTSGTCRDPGTGFFNVNSITARFSLGRTRDNMSAGDLFLAAKDMSPELATPAGLDFSTMADDTEVVYGDNNTLRQISARQTFLDIVTLNDYGYELRFYEPGARGSKSGGVYSVDNSTETKVAWRIENPDASPDVYNRLRITEIRGGQQTVHQYAWDNATDTWSLSKGGGLQVISKQKIYDDVNKTLTIIETVSDQASGVVVSKTRTVLQDFDWGREMIERTADPDGAALITSYTYYDDPAETGSYKKVASQQNPDGSWVKYFYDAEGRKIRVESPFLDAPISTPSTQVEDLQVTLHDYTPVDVDDSALPGDSFRPRTITGRMAGVVVEKTWYAYIEDNATGERLEITEQCTDPSYSYGDIRNLRTLRLYNAKGTSGPGTGQVKSVVYPDGRVDTYTYEKGSYGSGTFTPGSGTFERAMVTHGTEDSPEGIAYKTTREATVTDNMGSLVFSETLVYTGSGYEQISWTTMDYDDAGRLTRSVDSTGAITESEWGCCGKTSDTDSRGIVTGYTHDDLKRVATVTKQSPEGDIVTTYTYDAAGRRIEETVTAGVLSLTGSSKYDLAGRMYESTGTSGLVTAYSFDQGGRITTVTRPGGATEITERYLDGRIKSVTGTGVFARYYEYGVNTDGMQYTTVYTKEQSGPRWEKTTTDHLGRTVKVEKPGAAGAIVVTRSFYDSTGRLIATSNTEQGKTLYAYDEFGNQVQSGLDVDGNSVLDTAGLDRITESETSFVELSGAWWQQSLQRVYSQENNGTALDTGSSRTRLTGLGTDNLTAESVTVDINGSEVISKVYIGRGSGTETRVTDYPDSDTDAVSTNVNGLLVSSTGKSGHVTTYAYDGLGRRTGVTDPRTGTSTTHYDLKGRVNWVEDASGARVSYTYDPDSGLKVMEENADGKYTRYAYNDRGEVTHTWGDAAYPVAYVYDDYGQLVRMYTYREGSGFTGDTWPTGVTGDETVWVYDEATGLLLAKQDASGKQVTYSYTTSGRLHTRTWARDGGSKVTTYTYDPATGELLTIDYADSTQDISFTYDRLGRQKTITDTLGSRSFIYNNLLQLESETIGADTITRNYDGLGRSAGFTLGTDYSVTYGYDTKGRFNGVVWNVNSQTGNVAYGHLANSDLIETVTSGAGLVTTYSYEANRNLRTRIKNEFSTATVSQYDYGYDGLGRRENVVNSGSAFTQDAFNIFGYNDRSELTASNRYNGTDVADTTNPVNDEARSYLYDNIGNRESAMEALTKQITYDPNPLNQYAQITTDTGTPEMVDLAYDDDGNLLEYAGMQYTYNAENRLTVAEPETPLDGSKKVEYGYDYMGRRVRKNVSTYSGGTWSLTTEKYFVYDGWNLVKEYTTESGSTDITYYVHGLDISGSLQGAGGIGGLIARIKRTDTGLYTYDGNGNVGQLLDASDGSVLAHYEYDPFGKVINSAGTLAAENPFRFSTKYADDETGLLYYGYRYYSPALGRWLSRDPIEEMGGFNLYQFVNNNTVNDYDVLGLTPLISKLIMGCAKSFIKSTVIDKIDQWFDRRNACSDVLLEYRSLNIGMPKKLCKGTTIDATLKPMYKEKSLIDYVVDCVWESAKSQSVKRMLKNLPDGAEKKLIEKIADKSIDEAKKLLDISSKERKLKIKAHCVPTESDCKKTELKLQLVYMTQIKFGKSTISIKENVKEPFSCKGKSFDCMCYYCDFQLNN